MESVLLAFFRCKKPRNMLGVVAGIPRVHNVDIYLLHTSFDMNHVIVLSCHICFAW